MSAAHFVGGLLLIASAYVTPFWSIFIFLLVYCNLCMPTMALSNSISFRIPGEANQGSFPSIRLWGTIGWIAAGLSFAAHLADNALVFKERQIGAMSREADALAEPAPAYG